MAEPYYRMTASEALSCLDASVDGLSDGQAKERLEAHGPNQLAEGKKKSVAMVFLDQFKDLLVVILIIAAGISMLTGDAESTAVIIAVLILNAILGTVQYVKAEKSLDALKSMSAPVAKVLRNGVREEIAGPNVVPGDIVFLEAGDMVVADGRLIESYSLKVNESSLTGESEAVEKNTDALEGASVALGDQENMAFSGSLVTYGRGVMLVTGTGMQTEIGHIAHLMNQTQQRKTPLQQNLDDFSKKLAVEVLAVCVLVFALSVFRSHMPVMDSLLFAVALAVAAIPEALSSIVTIVLAMGMQKMAKENAIIKDLKAVESLGAVRVICSDKTGTLTQNKMTVVKAWTDGNVIEAADASTDDSVMLRLIRVGLLASDATTDEETGAAVGDPTEIALVDWGDAHGLREEDARVEYPRLAELAFDSDRKLMSTVHELDGSLLMLTKGAPDVLLARCARMMTHEGDVEMTDGMRADIAAANDAFSKQGLRVLAFANRTVPSTDICLMTNAITFVGLVAMVDPPRMESAQAVADAKRGGIPHYHDTRATTSDSAAIGRTVGIFEDGDIALEGNRADAMSTSSSTRCCPRFRCMRALPSTRFASSRRGSVAAASSP
ncbi:MAG: cation-translocating P-type ATPase [Slackia sp.]